MGLSLVLCSHLNHRVVTATYRSHSLSTTSTNPIKRLGLLDSVTYFIPTSITNTRVSVTGDLFRCEVCGITALGRPNEKYSSCLHAFLLWNESLFLSSLSRMQISCHSGSFFLSLLCIAGASSSSPMDVKMAGSSSLLNCKFQSGWIPHKFSFGQGPFLPRIALRVLRHNRGKALVGQE